MAEVNKISTSSTTEQEFDAPDGPSDPPLVLKLVGVMQSFIADDDIYSNYKNWKYNAARNTRQLTQN